MTSATLLQLPAPWLGLSRLSQQPLLLPLCPPPLLLVPTPPHLLVLCLAKPLPGQLESLQLADIKPVLMAAGSTKQIVLPTSIGHLAT